jgi:hypothetical protein
MLALYLGDLSVVALPEEEESENEDEGGLHKRVM